jgi:hypothetical protein
MYSYTQHAHLIIHKIHRSFFNLLFLTKMGCITFKGTGYFILSKRNKIQVTTSLEIRTYNMNHSTLKYDSNKLSYGLHVDKIVSKHK